MFFWHTLRHSFSYQIGYHFSGPIGILSAQIIFRYQILKKKLLCSLLFLSLPLNIYLKAITSTIEESVSYFVNIQELIIDVC